MLSGCVVTRAASPIPVRVNSLEDQNNSWPARGGKFISLPIANVLDSTLFRLEDYNPLSYFAPAVGRYCLGGM